MALKLNRVLDNNILTKTHKKYNKSELTQCVLLCFQGFSVLPNAVLSGLSLSGWSTCITVLCFVMEKLKTTSRISMKFWPVI